MYKKKVLIVDDDLSTTIILKEYFSKREIDVVTVNSAFEAAKYLNQYFFDLLITDINMPNVNGAELSLWMTKYFPETPIILISSSSQEDIKKNFPDLFKLEQILMFMDKPLSLTSLKGFIDEFIKSGFNGKFKGITLFDYFQLIITSGKSRIITVKDKDNNTGKIYLQRGKVIHAEYKSYMGEKAFQNLVALQEYSYTDAVFNNPNIITISQNTENLLMQSAQIIDESNTKINSEVNITANLKKIDLIDFIQLLVLSRQTKVVMLKCMETKKTGLIFIRDGQVKHAEFNYTLGDLAFINLLKLRKGLFYEIEWHEPSEISIETPTHKLLFNTLSSISSNSFVIPDQGKLEEIDKKIKNYDTAENTNQEDKEKSESIWDNFD